MKKKTVLNILMILCLLVAIGCGGYLAYYYYTSNQTEHAFEGLRELIVEVPESKELPYDDFTEVNGERILKKFERLYKNNNDFVGWIHVADTNIDYPVMYTPGDSENGEYYIHRDFEGNYSAAGLLFMDANCRLDPPTDNTIIYGHNMNSGNMFHDLLKYEEKEFYEEHKTFEFDTIFGDGTYEVVAVIRGQILPDDSSEFKYYEFVNGGSEEEFLDYVDNLKKMSLIDTGVEVEYGDKLVTLSTCAYHVKDGRFAVIGKKIEKEE